MLTVNGTTPPVELSENPLLRVSFAGMATKKGRREGAACILSFDSSAVAFCGRGALTPFQTVHWTTAVSHCAHGNRVLPGGSLCPWSASQFRVSVGAATPLQQ